MKDMERILEIANELNQITIIKELEAIKQRRNSENVKIILPLVGEFSAGKTTLINALTDNKQLETATKPTTSTIYEVHFGCEKCYAEVMSGNGDVINIDNISELKNEDVADAVVINIYDTSTKISPTTIIVDTPGLLSADIKHRQALVNFMPHADGIILVVDINSQLTRSLTEFVKTMEPAKRPVYLVLTKADTKSPEGIEDTKKYIKENTDLPIKDIICVSASHDNLQEFYDLMEQIQKDKNEIIRQVDEIRLKNIINFLLQEINRLQSITATDKDLDNAINNQEKDLKKISTSIERVVNDTECEISDMERKTGRKFQETVFDRLNTLVASKSINFDAEAISAINNTSAAIFNEYRHNVKKFFQKKASEKIGTEGEIALHSLSSVNLEEYSVSGISYNLDLNSIGHQYDGMIATGLKIAAATAAVATVAGVAGTGIVGAADMALDAADTVTDIQSIISNKSTANRIENAVNAIGKTGDKLTQINEYNNSIGNQIGCKSGIVESLVGFVTDKTWGKPQRIRAINNYIDSTLLPEFRQALSAISIQIINDASSTLMKEANDVISKKREFLNQLKEQKTSQLSDYRNRMEVLNNYKKELQTIL